MPTLVAALATGSGDDVDDAAVHLVGLPYGTATGHCMPDIFLCCCAPPERSPAGAAAMRAQLLAHGVVPAAVKAVAILGDGAGSALVVLEQYAPFDPAGAVQAGAIPAIRKMMDMYRLDKPRPEGAPLLTSVLATVYVQLSELAASAAMTLAAAQGSGLDKEARLELANEALAVIAAAHPYLRKESLEIQTELVPRHNALCTIGAAINANGGLAVPIAMSTPKDSRIEGGCGNSHLVNAPPEWAYGVDGLVDHFMRKPPVRVALAQGFVATAAPPAQQMAAPAASADVSTV